MDLDVIQNVLIAETSGDLDALRDLTTPNVVQHSPWVESTSVGQSEYLSYVEALRAEAPYQAARVTDVWDADFGILVDVLMEATFLETGQHQEIRRVRAFEFEDDRISNTWWCEHNRAAAPKNYAPPRRFEVRYVGGWPGLNRPIGPAIVRIDEGYLTLSPGSIPASVMSGRRSRPPIMAVPIGDVLAANIGDGPTVTHTDRSSAGEVLLGASAGLLAARFMSRNDLVALIGARAGAQGAAYERTWNETIGRIALLMRCPRAKEGQCTVVLENLPRDPKDQRKLADGARDVRQMWWSLQRERLDYGEAPLDSLDAVVRARAEDDGLRPADEDDVEACDVTEVTSDAENELGIGGESIQQLERLANLLDRGIITPEELNALKKKLLEGV